MWTRKCADLTLASNYTIPSSVTCQNDTAISTSATSSGTSSPSQVSGALGVANVIAAYAAVILGCIGAIIAIIWSSYPLGLPCHDARRQDVELPGTGPRSFRESLMDSEEISDFRSHESVRSYVCIHRWKKKLFCSLSTVADTGPSHFKRDGSLTIPQQTISTRFSS